MSPQAQLCPCCPLEKLTPIQWCFPERGRGLLPGVGEQSYDWVVQAVTLGPPQFGGSWRGRRAKALAIP